MNLCASQSTDVSRLGWGGQGEDEAWMQPALASAPVDYSVPRLKTPIACTLDPSAWQGLEGVSEFPTAFQAAIGQKDPHDRVLIEGEPHMDLVIPGGVHGDVATCAIVINAIPRLLKAAPGLHTMATIPPPIHVFAGAENR